MAQENLKSNKKLIEVLKNGGVAVIPTDTIYGIVGRAEDKGTVEKIYKIKKRNHDKKLITLISSWEDTKKFGIDAFKFKIPDTTEPTTFILNGTSFRLPKNEDLQELIKETGPLVAPSANPEDLPPSENIEEAKKYFGNEVDIYVDGGEVVGKSSTIIELREDGSAHILRA